MPLESREAIFAFFIKWLNHGQGDPKEAPFKIDPPDSLLCTPTGQVADSLGGETVFTLNKKRAAEILPPVHIYCKPITARPAVVIPVYSEEFWSKWFPRARSHDLSRFLALARSGRPYDKPHLMADLPEVRDRYMEALKVQQIEHMERSLEYCRKVLRLGSVTGDQK